MFRKVREVALRMGTAWACGSLCAVVSILPPKCAAALLNTWGWSVTKADIAGGGWRGYPLVSIVCAAISHIPPRNRVIGDGMAAAVRGEVEMELGSTAHASAASRHPMIAGGLCRRGLVRGDYYPGQRRHLRPVEDSVDMRGSSGPT